MLKAMTALETARKSVLLHEIFLNITAQQGDLEIGANETLVNGNTRADYDGVSEPCRSQRIFYDSARNKPQTWALQMYDASTKIPEGLLTGAFTHVGNFDECISIKDIIDPTSVSVFDGQHCLATIGLNMGSIRSAGVDLSRLPLKIATCVPSSCTPEDVAIIAAKDFKKSLTQMSYMFSPAKVEATVDRLECHTDESPELKTEDWIAVVVFILFALLAVLSTGYDILTKKSESRKNLLLAFSFRTNGKKLFAMSSSSGGDTLPCLHGIRFITIAWVVLGHRYLAGLTVPSSNLRSYVQDSLPDWKYLIISNSQLAVDTFFMMGGLLLVYVFLKQVHKTNSFNIVQYYVHRYVRLTPVLAIMVLFQSTLLRYVGAGPLWDQIAETSADICQDQWWKVILYVQNYVEPDKQCVGQSWYLAVDMQLYWVSPLILVPLWKRPRIALLMMGALMVGGAVTNYLISYENNFSGSHLGTMIDNSKEFQKKLYVPAYTRFMPYVIGMAFGYLLVIIKEKKKVIKIPKLLILLLWLCTAGLLLLTLCIVDVFQQNDYVYEPVGASMYNSLGRPGWALGVALVVFLCVTGNGGFVNTLLSWQWFQVLGRLSYSVYLVHMSIQTIQAASMRTQMHLDNYTLVPQFFGDLFISCIVAVPMVLMFESPFIILERELLGGKKKAPKAAAVASAPKPEQELQQQEVHQEEVQEQNEQPEHDEMEESVPEAAKHDQSHSEEMEDKANNTLDSHP
ncbi:nose resistant to fluoxetine protein 6 [Anabrus simplex]|uniref:nose resistant to fluoxetine protein 6 n=1 Tax=Anabrus simplex TaxID=316456 RepID=UPI0035A380AD